MWIEDIFFEDIFNMTGDGVYVTDEVSRIILSNRALCEMTGYAQEELLGMSGADLLVPDFTSAFDDFYNDSYKPEKCTFEAEYIRKDGARLPVELKITNLPTRAEGHAPGIIVSVRVITERKKAEQELKSAHAELQRSRDFFQNVFDMAGDGIHVTDELGNIVYANRAMCDLVGYELSDLLGMPAIDLTPALTGSDIDEDMLQEMYTRDYSSYFEVLYQRKDGTILTVEAKITNVLYGEEESPGLIISVRDTTERKRSEEDLKNVHDAMQRSRDFFENIFNMSGDGIYVTDELGNIIFANKSFCKMLKFDFNELIGKPAVELTPDLPGSGIYEKMAQEMYTMDYSNYFECLYQRKDGSILHVEAKVTNLQYASQDIPSLIVSVRDITERKQFEREIKSANDELERKVEERTRNIEEVNTALRVLLKSRDDDRHALEEKVVSNVRELITPYVDKLKKLTRDEMEIVYLDIISNNLNEIISPFLKKVKYFNLTPTEIQVANFIKHGKNTKEIAELLNLSPRTVEGHRDSIRKKLNLNKNKANLRTHLFSLD